MFAGCLGRLADHAFPDLVVVHMGAQAVRGQHEDVPRTDFTLAHVDRDVLRNADSMGNDVAPRPACSLLRADDAAVEEVLNLGVVTRDLCKDAVANEIHTAVTGPEAGELAVEG